MALGRDQRRFYSEGNLQGKNATLGKGGRHWAGEKWKKHRPEATCHQEAHLNCGSGVHELRPASAQRWEGRSRRRCVQVKLVMMARLSPPRVSNVEHLSLRPRSSALPGLCQRSEQLQAGRRDTVKLKGKPSGEVLVHKHDLQREGLRRTGSRSRRAGPQEPCWPPQGPPPPGDTGGGPGAEKTGGAVNGLGPAGDPGPPRVARVPGPVPPTAGDAGETDRALPASGETRVAGNGDSRVSSEAEGPAVDVPDHVPQIPAPDYPPHRGSAGDHVDPGEKGEVFQGHPEEERREEPGLDLPCPSPGKRSWGSLNGAVAAEVLSVHLKEEDPARPRRWPTGETGGRTPAASPETRVGRRRRKTRRWRRPWRPWRRPRREKMWTTWIRGGDLRVQWSWCHQGRRGVNLQRAVQPYLLFTASLVLTVRPSINAERAPVETAHPSGHWDKKQSGPWCRCLEISLFGNPPESPQHLLPGRPALCRVFLLEPVPRLIRKYADRREPVQNALDHVKAQTHSECQAPAK
ncbi:hypothetical protein QTO34_008462, partial [Cnephaeus nilssonii]